MLKYNIYISLLLTLLSLSSRSFSKEYDIVIYGATPAGISAAIQASRMDLEIVIIEPSFHIGGLITGGLGYTDHGKKRTIGGIALEFYQRVFDYYENDSVWEYQKKINFHRRGDKWEQRNGVMWSFEPKAALNIFNDWLNSHNITVITKAPLNSKDAVIKDNKTIKAIQTNKGLFSGKVFIDCSYEGDLMAYSGVSYTIGREASEKYNESLAGVLGPKVEVRQPKAIFGKHFNPFDHSGDLLPGIQGEVLKKPGTGDVKIQAYNFRTCLTTTPENKISIKKPNNYDSLKYELLYRYIKANNIETLNRIMTISKMPNNKTDINDAWHESPFSTDYIGQNWEYPDACYARRKEIWKEHFDFTIGLFYFLANDKRLPVKLRKQMINYGLPKDEYPNSNNWTPQLYIREARRMIGEYVLTQHDCQKNIRKEKSIGMGSYGPDSHHVQRIYTKEYGLINEGNFLEPHKPYEIPLGIILPRKEECNNLIVPVCVSSSHVAYGSIRMEPVYMIMGQSAAILAGIAIKKQVKIHDINYADLKTHLLESNQVLKFTNFFRMDSRFKKPELLLGLVAFAFFFILYFRRKFINQKKSS